MKTLDVRYLEFAKDFPELEQIGSELDKLGPGELIDSVNWNDFTYKPDVRFNIAYTDRELMLKYYVREDNVKAEMTTPDQAVWEDSCVEFFVSPEDNGVYFNLEVNPIGTCLLGVGSSRTDRSRLDISVIKKIRIAGSMGSVPKPLRAPMTTAMASADTPALICTTIPPAKSSAPNCCNQPPPQTQWAIGT